MFPMPHGKAGRLAGALTLMLLIAIPWAGVHAGSPAAPSGPASVELEFFIGTAYYPDHILLEWRSVSEIKTLGYRLFRGLTPDPDQTILLASFIPANNPGAPIGDDYSYQDSFSLTPGTVYYYWIEDFDTNDLWNQHLDDPNLNPVVPWGCSIYDVVCDFAIDSQDIAALASRWNCALGDACYLLLYDVNRDDITDVIDVMLSAGRWGCVLGEACYP
jgi:hypothetical protein